MIWHEIRNSEDNNKEANKLTLWKVENLLGGNNKWKILEMLGESYNKDDIAQSSEVWYYCQLMCCLQMFGQMVFQKIACPVLGNIMLQITLDYVTLGKFGVAELWIDTFEQ